MGNLSEPAADLRADGGDNEPHEFALAEVAPELWRAGRADGRQMTFRVVGCQRQSAGEALLSPCSNPAHIRENAERYVRHFFPRAVFTGDSHHG